jgi:hypothetical protein
LSDADPPLTMTTAARPTTTEPPVPGTPAITKIVVDVNCCPCSCSPPTPTPASPHDECCPPRPHPSCPEPTCSCSKPDEKGCCRSRPVEDRKIGDEKCCPRWVPFFNKF